VQIPEPAKALYPDAAIRAALTSLTIRAAVPIEEELGVGAARADGWKDAYPRFRSVRDSIGPR